MEHKEESDLSESQAGKSEEARVTVTGTRRQEVRVSLRSKFHGDITERVYHHHLFLYSPNNTLIQSGHMHIRLTNATESGNCSFH